MNTQKAIADCKQFIHDMVDGWQPGARRTKEPSPAEPLTEQELARKAEYIADLEAFCQKELDDLEVLMLLSWAKDSHVHGLAMDLARKYGRDVPAIKVDDLDE